jgi:hypothetical protein
MVFPAFLLSLFVPLWVAAQDPLFVEQARFQPADRQLYDEFSWEIALSGDGGTALTSAKGQDCAAGPDCGAVYVFARDGAKWVQEAKLRPAGTVAYDRVAEFAVSADGNVALLGVAYRDCAAGENCGAAFVFERSGGIWSEGQKLTDPEGSAYDSFGAKVALSGDATVAFVSDGLSVHVFRRSGSLFVPEARLAPSGVPSFTFGALRVSGDGETVLIRQDGNPFIDPAYGPILVFRRVGGSWVEEPTIEPPAPTSSLKYFDVLALSGDGRTAMIAEASASGGMTFWEWWSTVSIWTYDGAGWSPQAQFGYRGASQEWGTLSFDGDTAVIAGDTGVTQVFRRRNGVWTPGQIFPSEISFFASLSDDGRTVLLTGIGGLHIFQQALFSPDIPTVSEVGLALLALLLAGAGAARLRRV